MQFENIQDSLGSTDPNKHINYNTLTKELTCKHCGLHLGHRFIEGKKITLSAELFSIDGSKRFFHKDTKNLSDSKKLGIEIGKKLKIDSLNSYKK